MQSVPSQNPTSAPSAQLFVADQDLALYAALIGRKPMSKTLRESISESSPDQPVQPVMMTPLAGSADYILSAERRQRISVWLHDVSLAAKKQIGKARSRLSL